jgi:RHS repeat-associated protein
MGNRTQVSDALSGRMATYTSNPLNQTTLVVGTHPTLPTESLGLVYDTKGNLTRRGKYVYTYDDANRLTTIITLNTADNYSGTVVSANYQSRSQFVYDGLSRKRRALEQTWNGVAFITSSDTRYIYDGMDVIEERDNATNAATVKYTRVGNIGGLLARTEVADGKHYYYHYDGAGNVSDLTDETQTIVAHYEYDAYGSTLSATGVKANQPYRFSTKAYHEASGLYEYGYRFYSPGLGKWINRDPIQEAGGLNLYGAFANSPVNFGDEYGELVTPETIWDGANVVVGAASFGYNFSHGNYGAAVVDAAGLGYDLATTAIPILSGGAGVGIKALRGGQAVAHVAQGTKVAKTGARVGIAAVRSVGQITSASSLNQMQKEVEWGQAPSGIDRVDPANGKTDPQDHVHFKDGSAMHKDGGTKHKKPNGDPAKPTSKQRKWLEKHGWKCP